MQTIIKIIKIIKWWKVPSILIFSDSLPIVLIALIFHQYLSPWSPKLPNPKIKESQRLKMLKLMLIILHFKRILILNNVHMRQSPMCLSIRKWEIIDRHCQKTRKLRNLATSMQSPLIMYFSHPSTIRLIRLTDFTK